MIVSTGQYKGYSKLPTEPRMSTTVNVCVCMVMWDDVLSLIIFVCIISFLLVGLSSLYNKT